MIFFFSYLLLWFFLGTRLRALGNIMHECSHNIFAKKKSTNLFVGYFVALILFDCFDQYKKEHFAHHAFLGNSKKDVDCAHYQKIRTHFFQNQSLNILLSILSPYNWYLNLKHCSIFRAKKKFFTFMKLLYLAGLIALCFFYFKIIFLFYIFPYLTSYQIFKLFSDIVDHDFLYKNIKIRNRSRNHIFANTFLNWLIFPRNDAYHLIHHLYPSVAVSAYPKLHKNLLKKNYAYAIKNHSCDLQKFSCSGIYD